MNFSIFIRARGGSSLLSPAAMTFEAPDVRYPIEDDRKWATIVPRGRGFIRLGSNGVPFSTSLYHQLHCINGTEEARVASFAHSNHCFDVLRQSLLCKADTTLSVVGASNQTAITRRCRDWSQVRKFVDDNLEFWRDIPFTFRPTDTGNGTAKGKFAS
ncbi:hypothetical protein B0H13DRAFT_1622150 [Mycena leptocephala]|nr:hypothetical protein B0H13DRAFT_1622150 [Mycena leptocephala]